LYNVSPSWREGAKRSDLGCPLPQALDHRHASQRRQPDPLSLMPGTPAIRKRKGAPAFQRSAPFVVRLLYASS
jgi:hypothetical protein